MAISREWVRAVEQRIDCLEARGAARTATLAIIVAIVLPNARRRAAMCKRICDTFELLFVDPEVSHRHLQIDQAIDELEAIFQSGRQPPADESSAGGR